MEIIAIAAIMLLVWMTWQLYRARNFNRFKQRIIQELKPKVVQKVKERLIASRSQLTPNTDAHIIACQFYWTQHPARILQAALQWEIINKQWLQETGNLRNCQHLFYIDKDKLVTFDEEST